MVGNCLIPNKNKTNWLDGLDDNYENGLNVAIAVKRYIVNIQ